MGVDLFYFRIGRVHEILRINLSAGGFHSPQSIRTLSALRHFVTSLFFPHEIKYFWSPSYKMGVDVQFKVNVLLRGTKSVDLHE